MKSAPLLFIFLLTFGFASAQFESGKFAAGLNLGFSYDNAQSAYPAYRAFSIANDVQGEYFFHRNLSLVTGFEFEHTNNLFAQNEADSAYGISSTETIEKRWTVAPILGIRKYWFDNTGRFGLFIMPYGIVALTREKKEYTYTTPRTHGTNETTENYWSPYFKTDVGACYFFKPNFSIELTSLILQAYVDDNVQYIYFLRDLKSFRLGARFYF